MKKTFYLMIADIKSPHGKYGMFLAISINCILIASFFVGESMLHNAYIYGILAACLGNQFTKIFYVIPIEIDEIRRLVRLRVGLVDVILITESAITVVFAELLGIQWNRYGFAALLLIISFHIAFQIIAVDCFHKESTKRHMVIACVIFVVQIFVFFIMSVKEDMSLYILFLVGLIQILVMEIILERAMSNLEFADYKRPTNPMFRSNRKNEGEI